MRSAIGGCKSRRVDDDDDTQNVGDETRRKRKEKKRKVSETGDPSGTCLLILAESKSLCVANPALLEGALTSFQ